MRLMLTRLVFLAFIGLTGLITYNALYLQDLRNQSVVPKIIRANAENPVQSAGAGVASQQQTKLPAVTTDLPPSPAQAAPEQLVTAIQRELAARGYGSGPADGRLGEETRSAISAFERDKGLPVTGEPTDELLRYILLGELPADGPNTGSVAAEKDAAAKTLPAGADATVKQVQQTLADLGYAPGPVDGAMGRETERAVAAFQRDRKLAANGRITPELLEEMRSVTGRSLGSGTPRP